MISYKTVLKVEDQEYIFIKRSVSHKERLEGGQQQQMSKRHTLESDNLVMDGHRRRIRE